MVSLAFLGQTRATVANRFNRERVVSQAQGCRAAATLGKTTPIQLWQP